MASVAPVILILGYGPNIGRSVAQAFAAKGYKVALTSRKPEKDEATKDQLNVQADLSDPESVVSVFAKVKAALGSPSVVVYNGKMLTSNP